MIKAEIIDHFKVALRGIQDNADDLASKIAEEAGKDGATLVITCYDEDDNLQEDDLALEIHLVVRRVEACEP